MILNNSSLSLVEIGKIGKTVGLKGGLKFYSSTDFPQSIQKDLMLTIKPQQHSSSSQLLSIQSFDSQNMTIFFKEITNIDQAKLLTNQIAYASIEDTKKLCILKENEYFWFEIIESEIIENDEILGKVSRIERIGLVDYLIIDTSKNLVSIKLPKTFMVPYIDQFILEAFPEKKVIFTKGARAILEAS